MRNMLQHLANLCAILSCAITVYQLLHPAAPGALPTQAPAPLYAAAVEFKGVVYRLSVFDGFASELAILRLQFHHLAVEVAALPGEILNSLAVVELVDPPTQAQPGTVYSVFLGVLVLLLHGLFSFYSSTAGWGSAWNWATYSSTAATCRPVALPLSVHSR